MRMLPSASRSPLGGEGGSLTVVDAVTVTAVTGTVVSVVSCDETAALIVMVCACATRTVSLVHA
jgi:hypothetical protein